MMKIRIVFLLVLTCMLTACGSAKKHELRVGPTVTPIVRPQSIETATGGDAISLTDEEIILVIKGSIQRMEDRFAPELEDKVLDKNEFETEEYNDGGFSLIYTDGAGRETMILIFGADADEEKIGILDAEKVFFTEYDGDEAIYGAVYEKGYLVSYYEKASVNKSFYVELRPEGDMYRAIVSKGKDISEEYLIAREEQKP